MNDKFTIEIDKLRKIEKGIRIDIGKRKEYENKNQQTSIVLFRHINLD